MDLSFEYLQLNSLFVEYSA